MSEKSNKFIEDIKSWRSEYPELAVDKPCNEEKKFTSEFDKKTHVKFNPKSKRFIGFDGKLHEWRNLSLDEQKDFMLQNKYIGDKLWQELNNSKEFEYE